MHRFTANQAAYLNRIADLLDEHRDRQTGSLVMGTAGYTHWGGDELMYAFTGIAAEALEMHRRDWHRDAPENAWHDGLVDHGLYGGKSLRLAEWVWDAPLFIMAQACHAQNGYNSRTPFAEMAGGIRAGVAGHCMLNTTHWDLVAMTSVGGDRPRGLADRLADDEANHRPPACEQEGGGRFPVM